jgi:hypothetical protein
MRLFTIGEDFTAELNKEWLLLIPQFKRLIQRDKGSPGDNEGRRKLKAKKELAFIYFDLDFTSPIYNYEPYERRQEALRYATLTEKDIDQDVMAAHDEYDRLLLESSPSLKTLRSVEKSMLAFNKHLEGIDFTAVDKKGELLHNPGQYLMNMERLNKGYDSIDKFRKRVMEEMQGDQSIRGANSLGRNEGKRKQDWNETESTSSLSIPSTEIITPSKSKGIKQISFRDMAGLLKGTDGSRINNDTDEKEEEPEEVDE